MLAKEFGCVCEKWIEGGSLPYVLPDSERRQRWVWVWVWMNGWMDGGREGAMWMDGVDMGMGVAKAWWCGLRPARGWLRLFDHKPITHTQQATARIAIRTKSDSPFWGLHAAPSLWLCLFIVFAVDCLQALRP